MALVPVRGNLTDHLGKLIPADLQPEVYFRPEKPGVVNGSALLGVEVKADLNTATGTFTANLQAAPHLGYRLVARWLVVSSLERWSWQYAEWPDLYYPYPNGGVISAPAPAAEKPTVVSVPVLVQLADPPAGFKGYWLHSAPGDENNPGASGTGMLRRVG